MTLALHSLYMKQYMSAQLSDSLHELRNSMVALHLGRRRMLHSSSCTQSQLVSPHQQCQQVGAVRTCVRSPDMTSPGICSTMVNSPGCSSDAGLNLFKSTTMYWLL
jgi:hypothetical protein